MRISARSLLQAFVCREALWPSRRCSFSCYIVMKVFERGTSSSLFCLFFFYYNYETEYNFAFFLLMSLSKAYCHILALTFTLVYIIAYQPSMK